MPAPASVGRAGGLSLLWFAPLSMERTVPRKGDSWLARARLGAADSVRTGLTPAPNGGAAPIRRACSGLHRRAMPVQSSERGSTRVCARFGRVSEQSRGHFFVK